MARSPAAKQQEPPSRDEYSLSEFRTFLSGIVERVKYTDERIAITHYGKRVAYLISAADHDLLESIEDRIDLAIAERIKADPRNRERIPLGDLLRDFGCE